MYNSLKNLLETDSYFEVFDVLEEDSYNILMDYLSNNGWDDEAKRLKESQFIGVGIYRLLNHINIEYLDDSPENLIDFYGRCKRPKDEPHYEDLITTILLNIVTGIIACLLYDIIKELTRDASEEARKYIKSKYGKSIEYLFRGRWARELYWKKAISKEEYDKLLDFLKSKHQHQTQSKEPIYIYDKSELEFKRMAKRHHLELANLQDDLILQLIKKVCDQVDLGEKLEDFASLLKKGKRKKRGNKNG
jgi:hypothetical protein